MPPPPPTRLSGIGTAIPLPPPPPPRTPAQLPAPAALNEPLLVIANSNIDEPSSTGESILSSRISGTASKSDRRKAFIALAVFFTLGMAIGGYFLWKKIDKNHTASKQLLASQLVEHEDRLLQERKMANSRLVEHEYSILQERKKAKEKLAATEKEARRYQERTAQDKRNREIAERDNQKKAEEANMKIAEDRKKAADEMARLEIEKAAAQLALIEQRKIQQQESLRNHSAEAIVTPADVSYQFPQVTIRPLDLKEVTQMDNASIRYAINEMYARHGAVFPQKEIAAVFQTKKWYHPRPDLSFDQIEEREFSEIERFNIKILGEARDLKSTGRSDLAPGAGDGAPQQIGLWIIPDSSQRRLTRADLSRLNAEQLWRARNEIYARNGFIFSTPRGRTFAASLGANYHGTVNSQDRVLASMNAIERANVELIKSLER